MSKQESVFYAQEPMGKGYAPDSGKPGWGKFIEDSKGQGYEDSNFGDGTATAENQGAAVGYKPFDRGLACGVQDVSLFAVNQLHWFQQRYIIDPNGGVQHTVSSMIATLNEGIHTGLYVVASPTGRVYLCGLYAATGGAGWVKWDARTNTWTSGVVTSGITEPPGNRMGPCVAHSGKLVHATSNKVTIFDPVLDTIEQRTYTNGSTLDRVVVSSGRLFVVSASARIRIWEVAYGSVFEWLDLGAHNISGGDFALFKWGNAAQTVDDQNRFYLMYSITGGGFACRRIQTASGQAAPVSTNVDAMVPSAVTSDLIGGTENWQAAGGLNRQAVSWVSAFDNVDLHPGPTAGPVGMLKANTVEYFVDDGVTPSPRLDIVIAFQFNGEGSPMTVQAPTDMTGAVVATNRHSTTSSFLGGDDLRLNANRPKWWIISCEAYSDSSVARGMLIKFWGRLHRLNTTQHAQFIYGRRQMRPDSFCTLDGGTPALPYGGTATFNGSLNRLEDCDASDVPNLHTTLIHGAVTAGPFEFGSSLLGGTSGATGVVRGSSPTAIYLGSLAGGPFTPGETITQTNLPNVGANAVLVSQEDAVEHQVVWDLDADGVPAGEWVTIAPYVFSSQTYPASNPLTTDEDVVYSGYAPAVQVGASSLGPGAIETPVTTQSDSGQAFTASQSASPLITQSESGQAFTAATLATPLITQSESVQAFIQASAQTPLVTQSESVQVVAVKAFPSGSSIFHAVRSQVLPIAPAGSETLYSTRSAIQQTRGSSIYHAIRSGVPVPVGSETLHRLRGQPIPGQSVGSVQDARVITYTLPALVAGSVSDATVVIISGSTKPNMSVIFDSVVIGIIQPLDPSVRAPDEQKIGGLLDPNCIGTSGGIGPGVKGCEDSKGDLFRKV